ncbi:hypothetical protein D3875_02570 [Deinococcus cavernae]|uniref:Uncharacterized protein n=1 Tax=Deinococcus cavernae TaxID=2320857 RepID=A0A418VFP4_9DEIO|nr:hypothetical protein [Deinococcus cavernae]RJF74897.1 hypothetical protein D3875_02570 [Deinococcus cavernae]
MPAPTEGFKSWSEFFQGSSYVKRRIRVNPFAAATVVEVGQGGVDLPPAPSAGLVYPRGGK